MHTNWCVLIEISMEIGMLNLWLGLLVTAQTKENYFSIFFGICQLLQSKFYPKSRKQWGVWKYLRRHIINFLSMYIHNWAFVGSDWGSYTITHVYHLAYIKKLLESIRLEQTVSFICDMTLVVPIPKQSQLPWRDLRDGARSENLGWQVVMRLPFAA